MVKSYGIAQQFALESIWECVLKVRLTHNMTWAMKGTEASVNKRCDIE